MSYVSHGSRRERIAAIGLVGLIQGGIIAALFSGLAVQFAARVADTPLDTYNVPVDPPPPPDVSPPEMPRTLEVAPVPVPMPYAPEPIVPTTRLSTVTTVDIVPPPAVDPVPLTPAQPPAPIPAPAPDLSRAAAPRGNVGDWFPRSEYPASALRAGREGRVSVLLTIAPTGRATACEVISGSGDAALDAASCRLATRNGRFQPARDSDGNPTTTRLKLPPIAWRIE